jgi:hypothetical protein
MTSKQNFLGLVDASGEIRRAPLIGVQFLHESPVRTPYLERARSWFKTEDLQRLFLGHRAAARRLAAPRTRVFIDVFTPTGLPAVEISFE